METKPPVPRAILVGVQLPGVDDVRMPLVSKSWAVW
jgi:hypothetical protein